MKKHITLWAMLLIAHRLLAQADYILEEPNSIYYVCNTANATIPVTVVLNEPAINFTYQWQARENAASAWINVSPTASVSGNKHIATIDSPTTPPNPDNMDQYRLIVTKDGMSDTSIVVTIQKVTAAPTVTIDPPTLTIGCTGGSSGTLTSSVTGNYNSFQWARDGVDFTAPIGEPITVTMPGTYTLTAVNGCGSSSDESEVMAGNAPVVNSITPLSATMMCANATITLTASVTPSNATINWSGPGGFTATGTTANVPAPGTYMLTVTDAGCSTTQSKTVLQNDNDKPTASIQPPAKLTCIVDSVLLKAENITNSPTVKQWLRPNNTVLATGVDQVSVTTVGMFKFRMTKNWCVNTIDVLVQEDRVQPNVTIMPTGTVRFCEGSSATLEAVVDNPAPGATYNYLWEGGATTSALTVDSADTYSVTVTNASNGCARITTRTTAVVLKPVLSGLPTTLVIQSTQTADLIPTVQPGGATFGWVIDEFSNVTDPGNLSGNGAVSKKFTVDESRTYGRVRYVFTPVNTVGNVTCPGDPVSVDVQVLPEVDNPFIPEIYTPNGDGDNDIWQVVLPSDATDGEVVIFNRLGGKIYNGSLDTPWNGNACPDGTYFYVITYKQNGADQVRKGAVTILRTND